MVTPNKPSNNWKKIKGFLNYLISGSMPDLVTPTFASAYLMALAAGNLGGR